MSYHGTPNQRMGSQSVPPPTAPAVPASPPAPPPPPMQRTAPQTDPSQTYESRVTNPLGTAPVGVTLGSTAIREELRASNIRGFSAPGTRRRTEFVPVPQDDPRLIEIKKQVQRSLARNIPLSQPAYPVALDLATNELVFKGDPRLERKESTAPFISNEVKRTPRLRDLLGKTVSPIHIDGYFPLYTNREDAIKASPTPNIARSGERTKGFHTHFLRGKTYYMPNGLLMGVTMFHGDYDPPINDAGPYTVEGTATNDAPYKGVYGYYYPLWTSGALADQANANTQGGVHEHTFAEFPNVIFYMPNDQANHGTTSPGPYRLYRSGDAVQTVNSPVIQNVSQVLSTPVRFQIVNLDSSLSRKEEFIAGGTNAASPQFFAEVEEFQILDPKTGQTTTTSRTSTPSRISPKRSSLFNPSGKSSISNASKVSKAELTGTTKVVNESAELNNASRTQINGVVTPVVGQGGIIQDQQLFTFMSGSNIRIDTDGERREVIRISLDDLFLSELQDVDINLDADLANNRILVFDTSLGSGVTGITGGFKSKDFTTAFSSLAPRFDGLVSTSGVTGTYFNASSGFIFPDGTVQSTAAIFTDPESGVEFELKSTGTGDGIMTFATPSVTLVSGIAPGATEVITTGHTSGFSGDGITFGTGANTYLLEGRAGDTIHIIGETSNARVIGRLSVDAIDKAGTVLLAFTALMSNRVPYSLDERIRILLVPGNSKVLSFNGATGDVTGVASFNGSTGAVTGVASFNGSTGAVTGVASVNGSTGDIVGIATTGANVFTGTVTAQTGITLGNGITFPDGTFQSTAMRAGLKYTVTTSTPSAGGVYVVIDGSGVLDSILIHDTDANGNDIGNILDLFADNGGYIQLLKEDGSVLTAVAIDATETGLATFSSDKLSIVQVQGSSGTFEVDGAPSAGDVLFATVIPSLSTAVQSVGSFTGNIIIHKGLTAENIANVGYVGVDDRAIKFQAYGSGGLVEGITFSVGSNQTTAAKTDLNVATFTVSSKSAISVGAKTGSLHRLPYDATLTGIEIIVNNTGGFSAGVVASGATLGSPTQSSITGCTLGISGTSGTSTTIEAGLSSGSITSGNFLYLQVFDNTAGATNAQVFASYTRR